MHSWAVLKWFHRKIVEISITPNYNERNCCLIQLHRIEAEFHALCNWPYQYNSVISNCIASHNCFLLHCWPFHWIIISGGVIAPRWSMGPRCLLLWCPSARIVQRWLRRWGARATSVSMFFCVNVKCLRKHMITTHMISDLILLWTQTRRKCHQCQYL